MNEMNKKYSVPATGIISVLAISIIFLMAFSALTVQASPFPKPKITLYPSLGAVGTTVTVTGSGFTSGQTITLYWDGTHISPTNPTTIKVSGGTFSATFKVPTTALADKYYTVTAISKCGESACATFYVTCLFVLPEYPIGALAALGACFAALLVYKRKSLTNLHLNIQI